MSAAVRECCLRREFSVLYPGIEPEVWEIAANVAERVITRRSWAGQDTAVGIPRVLRDEHFDFRGGRRPSRQSLQSRLGEGGGPGAAL